MLAQQRYNHIMEQIEKTGSVVVNDVAAELSVSIETIRRDLIMLETHGKLKRVFGGAVALDAPRHFESLQSRLDQNTALKAELSRYAVSFIDNGDIIAMESGSTSTEMAKVLLSSDLNITIITHSDMVFNILKDKFKVVLIGGEYIPDDDCFAGALAEEFLKNFHVNKSFVFPSAVSLEHGIEGFVPQTKAMQRIFSSIADKTFVLADSDKFSARGMVKTLDLDPEFIFVTDSLISRDIKTEFAKRGLMLISGEADNADAE